VDQVLANVRAIPGVKAAGASTSMSPNRIQEIESYGIIGEPAPAPGHEPTAIYIPTTPGFVEALGIPLLSGRAFDARDGANAPHVAVISRELARRHFPHVNPIGHELSASGDTVTIVGVVGDVVYEGLGTPVKPVIYVPFAQVPFPGLWLAIRTTTPAAALAGPLREAYHRVDPELVTRAPVALETMVGESLVRPRFNAWLLSTFGALALILASIGIYSVIAYGVTQRRAELGIRLALGAPRSSVISTVLRGGLTPVIVGLAIGVVTAALASRLIAGLLYGISPTDAVTLAGSAAVLFATALLAAFIPAHRAARVDPLSVIRGD
jgi:putative ABC transport system permease protein